MLRRTIMNAVAQWHRVNDDVKNINPKTYARRNGSEWFRNRQCGQRWYFALFASIVACIVELTKPVTLNPEAFNFWGKRASELDP